MALQKTPAASTLLWFPQQTPEFVKSEGSSTKAGLGVQMTLKKHQRSREAKLRARPTVKPLLVVRETLDTQLSCVMLLYILHYFYTNMKGKISVVMVSTKLYGYIVPSVLFYETQIQSY